MKDYCDKFICRFYYLFICVIFFLFIWVCVDCEDILYMVIIMYWFIDWFGILLIEDLFIVSVLGWRLLLKVVVMENWIGFMKFLNIYKRKKVLKLICFFVVEIFKLFEMKVIFVVWLFYWSIDIWKYFINIIVVKRKF